MFLKLVALLLCIAYASCQEYVQSVDCANNTVHSRNVLMEVSGCKSTDERCPLYRGTNHTVVFTFEPTMDFMNKTDGRVYGVFDRFSVPYGKKTDACEAANSVNDDSSCRNHGGFKTNHVYKHTSKFAVSKNYPMIQLRVRFSFYDRRTKLMLLCREVPVEIKKNPESTSDETTDNNEA